MRELKDLLEPEYRELEAILLESGFRMPLPEQLLLRQSRCDRPDELQEVP